MPSLVIIEARSGPGVPRLHDLLATSVDFDLSRRCIEPLLQRKYHNFLGSFASVEGKGLVVFLMTVAEFCMASSSRIAARQPGTVLHTDTLCRSLLLIRWAHHRMVRGSRANSVIRGGTELLMRLMPPCDCKTARSCYLLSPPFRMWLLHEVGIFRCFPQVVKLTLAGSFHRVKAILVRPAQKISC